MILQQIAPEDTVTAYMEELGHSLFLCNWCGAYHIHGINSGWRSSHCDKRKKDYYLNIVGDITPEIIEKVRSIDKQKRFNYLIEWIENPSCIQIGENVGKPIEWDNLLEDKKKDFLEEFPEMTKEELETDIAKYETEKKESEERAIKAKYLNDERILKDNPQASKKTAEFILGVSPENYDKIKGIEPEQEKNAQPEIKFIELPGGDKLISEFANELGDIISPYKEIFYRPDAKNIIELASFKDANGIEQFTGFSEIKSFRFITLAEKYLRPGCNVKLKNGLEIWLDKSMSSTLSNTVLCSKNLQDKLPVIKRIFTIPLPIIYQGKLTFPKRGYDERFQSWLAYDAPEIIEPEMPIEKAKEIIRSLYCDFCFQNKQDYVTAVSALLTPFLRGLYTDFKVRTPLYCYVANRERAGKDYCEGITSIVYEGNALEEPPISHSESDKHNNASDELRKKILAAFIAGRKRLHFANNKGYINNAILEALITADTYSDRMLGKNEIFTFDNEMEFSLSGNVGIGFTADLINRSRFIRFFLSIEDANSRTFSNPDLHGWVKENRGLILSALYALVRNWIDTGSKPGSIPFTSFPEWAKICGGIMETAGFDNPCKPSDEALAIGGDTETADMKTLFEICYQEYPEQWITKNMIKAMAQSEDGLFCNLDFDKRGDQTKFGQLVIKFVGRSLSDIQMRLKDKMVRASRQEFMFSKQKAQDRQEIFGNLGNDGNDFPSRSFRDKIISIGVQDTKVTEVTNKEETFITSPSALLKALNSKQETPTQ